jgi:hypothetical protein
MGWRLRVNFFLRPVVKPMYPGEVAFSDQFCLGRQPMLHLVSLQRTLVHIAEVCPSGHFVRRRRKINFVLVWFLSFNRPGDGCRLWDLVLGEVILFHAVRIGWATARPLWGVHPSQSSWYQASPKPAGLGSDSGVNLPHRPESGGVRNSARQLPWSNSRTPWIPGN